MVTIFVPATFGPINHSFDVQGDKERNLPHFLQPDESHFCCHLLGHISCHFFAQKNRNAKVAIHHFQYAKEFMLHLKNNMISWSFNREWWATHSSFQSFKPLTKGPLPSVPPSNLSRSCKYYLHGSFCVWKAHRILSDATVPTTMIPSHNRSWHFLFLHESKSRPSSASLLPILAFLQWEERATEISGHYRG